MVTENCEFLDVIWSANARPLCHLATVANASAPSSLPLRACAIGRPTWDAAPNLMPYRRRLGAGSISFEEKRAKRKEEYIKKTYIYNNVTKEMFNNLLFSLYVYICYILLYYFF